ncbi:MAG: hypothetical protein AAFN77_11480 [Planctomycetota bacterium]
MGEFLSSCRVGPWYCLHCEKRTIFRRATRADAVDYRIIDPTEPLASPEDSVWVKADSQTMKADDATPVDQPIGNFIKSEKSLVVRKTRLLRFSEKYRDSIVERILSGNSTLTEVRHEKSLSEREILDWIADRVERLEIELQQHHGDRLPPVLQIIANDRRQTELDDDCASPKHSHRAK